MQQDIQSSTSRSNKIIKIKFKFKWFNETNTSVHKSLQSHKLMYEVCRLTFYIVAKYQFTKTITYLHSYQRLYLKFNRN
jgi:hypothetical protein